MSPAGPDLTLPTPLAVLIVLACIGIGVFLSRAHARRVRRQTRRRLHHLQGVIGRFREQRASVIELRRAIRAAGEGPFWTAIEAVSLKLTRREWLRLSRALERDPYSAAERRALLDDSPWRRALAARRLSLLHSVASRRALRRALACGPEMVTLAAAISLGRYRDRPALHWVLNHPNALVHRSAPALLALLKAFGSGALPTLTLALERGVGSSRLERAVVEIVGEARHRPARAALERRLSSGDLELRVAAARALGRLEAVECASSLLAALKDPAWPVRAQAARSLGLIRAPIATSALAARLTDASWWVRRHAAYALLELGDEGRAALRRVREGSPDPYAREMAEEALESRPRGAA
ncbi:MAG TPA: HEAT repeat domain-containing protein [Candidatus Eisenbacteria bacterium]|jgi:HEAT repeat protein